MGTKVQYKSFSPASYYPMRDLNEDANSGSWHVYYEGKFLKEEEHYNCFSPRSRLDASTEYDKLKQTILEHESLFRSQLYDLHRLYQTQRDLMNELRSKEQHKWKRSVGGSHSRLTSSQAPLEDVKKMWEIPTPYPLLNGCTSKEHESIECKVPRKRMFDLQLPADEYLGTEEELNDERKIYAVAGKPFNGNYRVTPEVDVKLSLTGAEKTNYERNSSKYDSQLWDVHGMADLNQPILVDEVATSRYLNFMSTPACQIQAQVFPPKPKYSGLPMDLSQTPLKDGNIGSHTKAENEGNRKWAYNLEAGQTRGNFISSCQGSGSEKLPALSESQIDFRTDYGTPEVSKSDYKKRETQREKAVCGIEIPESSFANCNYPGSALKNRIPISYPVFPHLNGDKLESKGSPTRVPSVSFDYLHRSINKSAWKGSEEVKLTFRGSDCIDVKSAKGMDLNVPNGFQDREISQHDIVIVDGEQKNGNLPEGLPWMRERLASENRPAKGKESTNETGLGSLYSISRQASLERSEMVKIQAPSFLENLTLASSLANETQSVKMSSSPDNRKILGVPIIEKSCISEELNSLSSSSEFQNPSQVEIPESRKVGCSFDFSRQPSRSGSGQKLAMQNLNVRDINRSGFRSEIDLNLCIDEDDSPSEIDLEAPVSPETRERFPPNGDWWMNQLEETVQSSTRKDPLEELEKIASEAIVFMSASTNLQSFDLNSSEESLMESLNWFADIISSNMADLERESRVLVRDNEDSSKDIDSFESMTLRLTETKFDELSCKIWEPEVQEEEKTGNALSLTRRGRGQSRRGRQKRDFQKDILPGLVSLSRYEVTEDLQAFGGMMRATGHPWKFGNTRRNAAKNGRARGKRRTEEPPPTTVPCSPKRKIQHNNTETRIEERSLKGWGKTTRRPRRQRLPAGTLTQE